MSAGRALNDEEVQAEMKKMVAFIKQEALEKAKEIKVKADEEFNIEKAKLVRQETVQIDTVFQKKIKQAEVQRKIAQSNHSNKCRLKVLQARQDLLQDLFNDAKAKLQTVTKNDNEYKELLKQLLVQGLYQLLETEVTVQCRQVDMPLVKAVLTDAVKTAKNTLKFDINVTLDEKNTLPEESIGGVILSAQNGRIKCLNSLKDRLDIVSDMMLPEIRVMLYGPSPNRRFFD
ncbi:ATPase, V1/A1 complex, subunit E [Paraphysoderma sedebokerense]|nr:ATPase, V1/A1 complex, subunit E [Paraphysoderma sedebokerense]